MNSEFYASGIIYAIEQLHQFRDDCAIRALGSLIEPSDYHSTNGTVEQHTKKAYEYADSMLKAKFN